MKVQIDNDRRVKFRGSSEYEGGWYYREALPNERYDEYTDDFPPKSERCATYAEIKAKVIADGHELSNAGWKQKMLSWNWYSLSFNEYEDWEIINPGADKYSKHPAYVKLSHKRVANADVESSVLANAWDDIAEVPFYQRDHTSSGIPFCDDGEIYWSSWWFASFRDRDRFIEFARSRNCTIEVQ